MSGTRRALTDAFLKNPANLPPAEPGKRYAISDTLCPGLRVRVTDRGSRTYVLWKRFGAAKSPSARAIGEVGVIPLADARATAREWLLLAKAGKDPAVEKAREQAAEADRAAATFGRAMEDYYRHIAKQRQADAVQADIERDLMPFWRDKPLHEFRRRDIVQRITEIADGKHKKKGTLYQAHRAFGNARTFFNWARDTGRYDLEAVPTDAMRPSKILGSKEPRQRVLNDDELHAFWFATSTMDEPHRSLLKVLLLTGARKNEIAKATWPEIETHKALMTIPPARFKAKQSHLIPLSSAVLDILAQLPRLNSNQFVFSDNGFQLDRRGDPEYRPAEIWTKNKKRLDAAMLAKLQDMAAERGENPATVKLEKFVIHDLRRTVRTRLSQLKVQDTVAELVIGHGVKGIQRVYNMYKFLDEMRDALQLWANALNQIADPEKFRKVLVMPAKRSA